MPPASAEFHIPWQLFVYLLLPAAIIYLCCRYAALRKIGVVLFCYILGIILGNSGFFPESAKAMQEGLANGAVAFALPMLLFTMDVRRWFAMAGKAMISMAAACVAAMAMGMLGSFLTFFAMEDSWKVCGMAVGVYTGGTPNVAAIRSALSVDMNTFVIFHTYDTIISVIYIIFCMTAAQRVFGRFLAPFPSDTAISKTDNPSQTDTESIQEFKGLLQWRHWPPLMGISLLSLIIVVLGAGAGRLTSETASSAATIVVITTLGIGVSFIPAVRNVKFAFQWGMYIIYLFCCIVGSMVDVRLLTHLHIPILFMVVLCVYGTMALHAVLCRLLHVDVDTFIITSVSAICSPPFVPPVAEALHNRDLLLSGITTGIVGYAVGNYLGILAAYIMRILLT